MNEGENVEQVKSLHIANENVNGVASVGDSLTIPQKLNLELLFHQRFHLYVYNQEK